MSVGLILFPIVCFVDAGGIVKPAGRDSHRKAPARAGKEPNTISLICHYGSLQDAAFSIDCYISDNLCVDFFWLMTDVGPPQGAARGAGQASVAARAADHDPIHPSAT